MSKHLCTPAARDFCEKRLRTPLFPRRPIPSRDSQPRRQRTRQHRHQSQQRARAAERARGERDWRWEAGVHEPRPAIDVYLLGGGDVRARDWLAAVRGRGVEDGHRVLQAGVTRWLAAPRETRIQRQVIHIAVGRRGGVRHGVGETVCRCGGVFEA